MKLSEFKGEEAILLMADLLEPITTIVKSKDTADFYVEYDAKPKEEKTDLEVARFLIKHFSAQVMEILALMNRVDIHDVNAFNEYKQKVNGFTVIREVLELISDSEIIDLFTSQGLSKEETSSISAMESIEA